MARTTTHNGAGRLGNFAPPGGRAGSITHMIGVQSFVEEVLQVVELESVADAVVGRPESGGLSRQQIKRVTIAVELVGGCTAACACWAVVERQAAACSATNMAVLGLSYVVVSHEQDRLSLPPGH